MNTPKIEQWMRDAANSWLRNAEGAALLSEFVAKHAPAQPAELPSIWKPVSQKPTKEDADLHGAVAVFEPKVGLRVVAFNSLGHYSKCTHWCRIADLLSRCPLPKVKTQGQLDAEFIAKVASEPLLQHGMYDENDLRRAIAYGRATANTEEGK